MAEMKYICAYFGYLDSIELLNDEERGRLFTALLTYGKTGQPPDLKGNERFVFPEMKAQIDRDKAKYDSRCEKQREKANKRWHDATAYSGMPVDAEDANTNANTNTNTNTNTKAISLDAIFS